jgi:hypothetical protein
MTVNEKMCCVISSVVDEEMGDGSWKAIKMKFHYAKQGLPSLGHVQSTLYNGFHIGESRKERAKPAKARPEAIQDEVIKIYNSDLIITQKPEAPKKFVMQIVDFRLHSGDQVAGSFSKFDQHVHRTVTEEMAERGYRSPFST